MAPYQRKPGKHFCNQMYSPYFQTENYKESHLGLEEKIEQRYKKLIAFIMRKNKNVN
jgi:hypothetical protein